MLVGLAMPSVAVLVVVRFLLLRGLEASLDALLGREVLPVSPTVVVHVGSDSEVEEEHERHRHRQQVDDKRLLTLEVHEVGADERSLHRGHKHGDRETPGPQVHVGDRVGQAGEDQKAETLREQLLAFEAKEFAERAERYPTDRMIRYHLGEVALRQGDIETAMGCFQKSKDEPRLRSKAGHLLGRCFAVEGWHAEAIAEYRDVLNKIDASEAELELEIRYDLMVSLIDKARRDESEELAREALDICSSIARKDITYRDIRDRRRAIDELVKSL